MNNVLNLFGLGRVKYSASLASVLSLAIFLVLRSLGVKIYFQISIFLVILLYTLLIAKKNLKEVRKDSKEIVIDEFLGVYLMAFLVDTTIALNMLLLVIFRIVDLTKIWPFHYLDDMKNPYAFLLDDLAIGLVIGAIFLLVTLV